jgi:hypothetical protein
VLLLLLLPWPPLPALPPRSRRQPSVLIVAPLPLLMLLLLLCMRRRRLTTGCGSRNGASPLNWCQPSRPGASGTMLPYVHFCWHRSRQPACDFL